MKKFPLNSFSAFLNYHNNTEHNICFVIEYKIDPIRDWSDNNSPYHHTIFYFNDIDVNIPRQYRILWLDCFKLKLGTGMKSYRNFRMNLNMLIKISKKKWTEKFNGKIATPHSATLIVISIGLSLSALLHGCPSCHCLSLKVESAVVQSLFQGILILKIMIKP